MKKTGLVILVLLSFLACKKKEKDSDSGSTVPPPVSTPLAPVFFINIPSDAYGVLMASRFPYTFSNNFVTLKGDASAFFYTAPGDYHYVDAGVVKCNDSLLTKQSSGAYVFNSKAKNGQATSGTNYSLGSAWSVAGTSGVPAFTYSITNFPTDAFLTSSILLNKTAPYIATFNGASNSDSVVVLLGCDSVMQKQTVSASSGICNFTQAQVASVKKAGSVNKEYINLISYRIQSNTVSGKKYYLVNSNTATYTVNIQ